MASNVQNGFVADGGVGSDVALGRNVSSDNGDDGRSLQGTAQGAPSENIVQPNSERPVLSSATDSNGRKLPFAEGQLAARSSNAAR